MASATKVQLLVKNLTKGNLVADRADVADTSEKRRTGLLKHTGLQPGEGLWIVPCEAVHTFAMNFAIDVVYLNKKRQVVKIKHSMPKSRMSFCLRAHSVLELPAGHARNVNLTEGDQLELVKQEVPVASGPGAGATL